MSSLFSALTVAVGGLGAQSAALGNISDDLSNAQTTGFKAIGTNFESLVTSSNASDNEPGGVRATPQYANDVQGNLVQSSVPTSLAISGQGFFAVTTASQDSSGNTVFSSNELFTREGDFTLDKNGDLVNGSGYYLLGYSVDPTTGHASSTLTPINISSHLNSPVATSAANYTANLPAGVASGFTSAPSTVQIFDGDGGTHNMTLTWKNTGANTWDLTVDVANGAGGGAGPDYVATVPFTFNGATNIGTIETIGAPGVGDATSNYTVPDTTGPADVSFNLNFGSAGPAQPVTLNFGNFNSADGLTQFAGTAVSVSSFSQNGLPQGSFNSLSIDDSGNVAINYSNGSTQVIAQIPIVQFFAQDQLQRVTGNAYEQTLASGDKRTFPPGTNGGGTIVSSSLESSNVDIATEFTDMIQAQQVYSANAKTITTVDNMLNTVINTIQ